jgi:alpha-L-arabinofuranosidase
LELKLNLNILIGEIKPELHGHFIEFLGESIYGGIWVGEDSDIENIKGIRKDVIDALKEIEPPIIRWPGGCFADTYHWRDGVGPKNLRPVNYNENFQTYEIDNNQFGTHEFMELCHLLGAKPWFNVNMLSSNVPEMKEWMEYCNRDAPTTLAQERLNNGSNLPFNVEYWGLGNEMWAGGGNYTAQLYASEYRKYATAAPTFKSVDDGLLAPSKLKFIACGPDGNKPKERVNWTKDFFASLSQYRFPPIFGYDLHFYNWNLDQNEVSETEFNSDDWYRVIDSCFELEDVILEQHQIIQECLQAIPQPEGPFSGSDYKCELIVGEWGNWHRNSFFARPALFQQATMRDAITTALTLDIFHRHCDKVSMACVAQTVNVLNSLILTNGKDLVLTTNYHVFNMYKHFRGSDVLSSDRCLEENLYLCSSKKDGFLFINLVNSDLNKGREIKINNHEIIDYVKGEYLYSDDVCGFNSFESPLNIAPKLFNDVVGSNGEFTISLLPASITSLQFSIKG